jgi:mannose/cellobiose epimerase-like protein (N-acyl-D-glucosamine 2-epimerase family)
LSRHPDTTTAGSWHHELDPDNRPASAIWPGKPDVYHAYQAVLLTLLPPRAAWRRQ